MEPQKMNFYGVGPKIMKPTVIYGVIAIILTLAYPETFLMKFLPSSAYSLLGGIILGFGIAFLYISSRAMKRAVTEGELETSGTFALVRNPLYFGWIIFIFPGCAIVSQSWLIFGMSAIAYYRFTKLISYEEATLEEIFGDRFTQYKKDVPAIIPKFRTL